MLIKQFLYKLKPFFLEDLPLFPSPTRASAPYLCDPSTGQCLDVLWISQRKMCSSSPWLMPPQALRTAGAASNFPNFRSYCKEIREQVCPSCIFLPGQAERDLGTFEDVPLEDVPPPPPCGMWSILIYHNSISKAQCHTWSKGGLQLVTCPLFFVKLHEISGFESRATSRQLCWMEPLIIWEIYSSFSRLRRLEMRAPLFLLVLTPVVFGAVIQSWSPVTTCP